MSTDKDDPWVDKHFESAVRATAYFLWEYDGRPDGREQDYWFAALERCLREREADGLLTRGPITADTGEAPGPAGPTDGGD